MGLSKRELYYYNLDPNIVDNKLVYGGKTYDIDNLFYIDSKSFLLQIGTSAYFRCSINDVLFESIIPNFSIDDLLYVRMFYGHRVLYLIEGDYDLISTINEEFYIPNGYNFIRKFGNIISFQKSKESAICFYNFDNKCVSPSLNNLNMAYMQNVYETEKAYVIDSVDNYILIDKETFGKRVFITKRIRGSFGVLSKGKVVYIVKDIVSSRKIQSNTIITFGMI